MGRIVEGIGNHIPFETEIRYYRDFRDYGN
jgi:hypothetical protein